MKITVIGAGRWGSFIAWYLDSIGHKVTIYGKPDSESFSQVVRTRSNGTVNFRQSVQFSTELDSSLHDAQMIVISINSQGLRALMESVQKIGVHDKIFVLCMKGLEMGTGMRLSEIVDEFSDHTNRIAVWVGPGHVEQFLKGTPNCMVIDSVNSDTTRFLIDEFSSELIRFYLGRDLIGSEIGAAAKNVMGIAAGILDGLGLSCLKGSLMSRGTREIARLIKAAGGNELSAYGLCHLGDYEATLFSEHSHNRQFGEKFVKGEQYTQLAEGYYTVCAILDLAQKYGAELPICQSVKDILYNRVKPEYAVNSLFLRPLKDEFYN